MKQTIEVITPERAADILAHKNTRNRPMSLHKARTYADDMSCGLWDLTHQGIAFYPDGTLADGQTRLKAIVLSGTPIEMSVAYDMDSPHIDGVRVRSMKDQINMSCFHTDRPITARDIAIIRIEWGTIVTISQAILFFETHRMEFDFINSLPKTNIKNGQLASVQLAMLKAAANDVPMDKLREFYDIYLTGACKNENQWAAIRLKNHIIESKKSDHASRVEYSLKAQFAIKCYLEKKAIHKIFKPEYDIYPI